MSMLSDTTYKDTVDKWFACGCFSAGAIDEYQAERIREHLAANHRCWSGDCRRDYLFHVGNQHPLLGILLCHPLHPLNKVERLCLEWLRCAGTVAWLVILEDKVWWLRRLSHGELDQMRLHMWIFLRATLPIAILRAMLQWIAVQTGRPGGVLEKALGHACACVIQWWLMLACFGFVCSLSSMCFALLYVSGPWNAFGEGMPDAMKTYQLAWRSIVQGWLVWFVLDLVAPVGVFRCPWVFGFFCQWKKEKEESNGICARTISLASSSSGSCSGEEGLLVCLKRGSC